MGTANKFATLDDLHAIQGPGRMSGRGTRVTVDRALAKMIRWADGGGLACYVLDGLSRFGPPHIRSRLATQNVYYALLKLRESFEVLGEANPQDWHSFAHSMIEPIGHLAFATDDLEVLLFGEEAFAQARLFPWADDLLRFTLRWHDQVAVRSGLRGQGTPPEPKKDTTPFLQIEEPIWDIRKLSYDLRDSFLRVPSPPQVVKPESIPAESGAFARASEYDATDRIAIPKREALTVDVEPKRYTDLTIYEGHRYPSDLPAADRLSDELPLVANHKYTLEVAIRLKRTGIDAHLDPPHAVLNPRRDTETLNIYVQAKPLWPGITIPESFAEIKWPHNKDSESAVFRLEVMPLIGADISQGAIEVRIYRSSLDLLDIVQVFITVTRDDPGDKRNLGIPARRLLWPDEKPDVPQIDIDTPVRDLSIHVSPEINGYGFDFTFRHRNGKDIVIPASRRITTDDVRTLLEKIRDFWTELVITNYSTELSVTGPTFGKCLDQLAEIGKDAWSLLFGTSFSDQKGAAETLGSLLANLELRENTRIQITYSSNLIDFIFPWSVLYPPTEDWTVVDPLRFWGARYQIEQVRRGPTDDMLTGEPISVMFALDPGFGNSVLEEDMFKKYKAAAAGRLAVTDPISDQAALFGELVQQPPAHLFYFYCHGYAPAGSSGPRRDGVQLLKKRIESIPEKSPARRALDTWLSLIEKMGGEAWIYLGDSEIKESKLTRQRFFGQRRPIIFLNMCHSAGLLPSMSSGLVRVFLDHNASAVIGTESPMTSIFAHAFAEVVLNALLSGEDAGTALWKARRQFLGKDMRNPLGLAYTLYGRATARLGNGPIIAAGAKSNSQPLQTNR